MKSDLHARLTLSLMQHAAACKNRISAVILLFLLLLQQHFTFHHTIQAEFKTVHKLSTNPQQDVFIGINGLWASVFHL